VKSTSTNRPPRWPGRIVVLDSVDSTNDALRRLAARGAADRTVVVAGEQSAGKGRRGRVWESPAGLGLYVSVLFRPGSSARSAAVWTLAASVAAAAACRRCGATEITIKWPNDLVWNGRKLGGVLAEARTTGGVLDEVVVGAGINVLQGPADFAPAIAAVATSLRLATRGETVDRDRLLFSYLETLGRTSASVLAGTPEEVVREWESLAPDARGAGVRVFPESEVEQAFSGETCGLDPSGALRVRLEDGRMTTAGPLDSVVPLSS
jgi:BirA family biotin operon repressor/biotin-[acetyl-CoA-carboxylase] ligase